MWAILFFLLGCTKEVECSETKACPFGSSCVEGKCEAQSCVTSEQCPIESYCKDYQCQVGCQSDADCRFGDKCNAESSACEGQACSDTRTDCAFGEFCGVDGGCYEAGGYYCRGCSDDGDCGGNGNLCLSGYCGVTCDSDKDCPNGYDCLPVTDINGNVYVYQCWTYCWLYEE